MHTKSTLHFQSRFPRDFRPHADHQGQSAGWQLAGQAGGRWNLASHPAGAVFATGSR